MRIRLRSCSVAVLLLIPLLSGCEEKAEPQDIDAVWNDLSSEERVAYLEVELGAAQERLEHAHDLEAWSAAHQRARAVLSLLRPEIWPDQRAHYIELETTLDELARRTHDAL